jgi:thymidine phosphorylase
VASLVEAINQARNNALGDGGFLAALRKEALDEQLMALAVALEYHGHTGRADLCIAQCRDPVLASALIEGMRLGSFRLPGSEGRFGTVLSAAIGARSSAVDDLRDFISAIGNKTVSPLVTAFWLMAICLKGVDLQTRNAVTLLMRDSGQIVDYRRDDRLRNRKHIRRYPTGGLSEKLALLLPALLVCARKRLDICSPFLVARSLGFTGGTWSKLSRLSGFRFATPGEETAALLASTGVAYCVTHHGVNPADEVLYLLRSRTGTVECIDLAFMSIASKQLSYPVDCLALDVRTGPGAFFDRQDGQRLASEITSFLSTNGLDTYYTLTSNIEPDGAAIGNALEVAEAIMLLQPSRWTSNTHWEIRALMRQTQLLLRHFSHLLNRIDPFTSREAWQSQGWDFLVTGAAISAFRQIAMSHGVSAGTMDSLLSDPMSIIRGDTKRIALRAPRTGTIVGVDQRALGHWAYENAGTERPQSCDAPARDIILRRSLGDSVSSGDVLLEAFVSGEFDPSVLQEAIAIK